MEMEGRGLTGVGPGFAIRHDNAILVDDRQGKKLSLGLLSALRNAELLFEISNISLQLADPGTQPLARLGLVRLLAVAHSRRGAAQALLSVLLLHLDQLLQSEHALQAALDLEVVLQPLRLAAILGSRRIALPSFGEELFVLVIHVGVDLRVSGFKIAVACVLVARKNREECISFNGLVILSDQHRIHWIFKKPLCHGVSYLL